jgi:hypothetical protein
VGYEETQFSMQVSVVQSSTQAVALTQLVLLTQVMN